MADWANTVVGLWDLAVRIANFANDIRSAQDDFVGLRAEAECLLICVNSLNSPSCRDALYKYITTDQATDLETLVKNTRLNMKELNEFIAKCWRLVEKDLGRDGLRRRGWRRLGMRLKQIVAKTWAKYWFAMADKQAFRDKLVLPAQSVNIYLTSLTHIGLVNVGFLMQLSGHGSGGCSCACGSGKGGRGGGGGGRSGGGRGGGSGPDGGAPVIVVDPLRDWKAVGRQLAFKEAIARRTDLTPDIEEEIIAYALHLMNGGAPFNSRPSGSGSTGGKQRFTKTTTRVRSRSRSRAPLGSGVRKSDRMYLVRKKSTSKPSASRVEIVDLERTSDSDGDYPRRPLLALPAPDTPSSGSGPQVIEIKPPGRQSGSPPSDGSDSSGPGRRPPRSPTPSPPPSPPIITASGALHPDDDHSDASVRRFRRAESSRMRQASSRTAGLDMSREQLQARRRMVMEQIQAEADAAVAELEAKQAASRNERRRYRHEVRQSSGTHHQPSAQEEHEEDKRDDILEMCSIIEEEYGVRVVPLPEGTREPIFAPKVKPAVPLDDDEAGSDHSGDGNSRRRSEARKRETISRRTVVESSASERSEEEDEMLVKSMSRRQGSRLKAETSLLGSTMAGQSHGPRTFGYEDPYVRSRSHSFYPEPGSYRQTSRFEPYPTRPYDRARERERRHSEYPSAIYQDEKHISPERTPYVRFNERNRRQPNVRDDSDDDSLYGTGRPVPGPKGPGPAPPAPPLIIRTDQHMDDVAREKEVKELRRPYEREREVERERPSFIIAEDRPPPSFRPRVYHHRSAPGDIQHPQVIIQRHDSGSEDDYDQRSRISRA
ncbi:hypothetical protein B0A52_04193 [Exophiala mesophila]|uniref:Uncharacterized protein n=1 Tax=Exophiala mesophila TaxID=212818 RepID=A0A438N7Q2_EXOME|nr:hypothetical protein B0A52_04193 [Exophiala mesophila]